jgi:hypothetical protein
LAEFNATFEAGAQAVRDACPKNWLDTIDHHGAHHNYRHQDSEQRNTDPTPNAAVFRPRC